MTPAEQLAQALGAPPLRGGHAFGGGIVPMLCEREEASEKVLARPGWRFELKLDGVRILADKNGADVSLRYRTLRGATESYAEIVAAVRSLADARLVLDGEIVAFDEDGRPDFQRLGHRIQVGPSKRGLRSPPRVPVVYVVFDVLAVGAFDLRGLPLEARKEILARVVPQDGAASGLVRVHPTFESGVELFRLCEEHRLEGVVAKRLGSAYRSGERTLDWLKIKAELDAEFVVVGWTEGERDRARLGALDLGAYEGDRLVYRGRVGSGLDAGTIDVLLERLLPTEVDRPVAEGKYSPKGKRHHCRPEIVVSVRYGGFSLDPTGARFLRFPVFRGVRPDVSPRDCTAAPDDGASPGRRRRIHVTAPSQAVLRDGTTKDVLCTYFESVAPALLRHTRGRVCTLLDAGGAALWPPPRWTPKFVRTSKVQVGARELPGFAIDSVDVLLFAVEAGCSSIQYGPSLEARPDVANFAAVRVSGEPALRTELVAAARSVRALASELGLPAVVTSAGAGALDVVVGIGEAPSSSSSPLGGLLARLAGGEAPAGVRLGALDAVPAPYSPLPCRPGEPVAAAVPLSWDELDELDLSAVGLAVAVERAARAGRADTLDAIAGASVDVAAAARTLERIVTRRT